MRQFIVILSVFALAVVSSKTQLQAQFRTPTVAPPVGGQLGSVGGHLGTTPNLSTSLTPTGVPNVQLGPSSLNSGLPLPQTPTVTAVEAHSATNSHRPSGRPTATPSTTPVANSTWQSGSPNVPAATVDDPELKSFRAVALHAGGEPPKDHDGDDGDSREGKTKWWLWLLIVAIGIVIAARIRR